MQLLSSENKNLPLKIPCKKVTWLLLERKNTSVVQKACRSCITKSASRTKSNKQQNPIYNKQTKICNKTKYTTTNCKRWKYWWITKTAVPQPCRFTLYKYCSRTSLIFLHKSLKVIKKNIFQRTIQDTFVWLSVSKVFT